MIFRLGLVDLVDGCANSFWVQPVAILELSVFWGRAPPSFSCIPLSQCKCRAICRGERLHVTVFGKIAILSPWASFSTNIQCFEEMYKYFCMEQSLAWSSRMESPPCHYHLPSGLLSWRTQIVFLFWDFVLQESHHFFLWNSFHLHSRCAQ